MLINITYNECGLNNLGVFEEVLGDNDQKYIYIEFKIKEIKLEYVLCINWNGVSSET